MPELTFSHALDVFTVSPSNKSAGDLLRIARDYEADGMIGDDTFQNTLATVQEWLSEVTHQIELTDREFTLIRVALMQRLDRLKGRSDSTSSYEETRALLDTGGKLALPPR